MLVCQFFFFDVGLANNVGALLGRQSLALELQPHLFLEQPKSLAVRRLFSLKVPGKALLIRQGPLSQPATYLELFLVRSRRSELPHNRIERQGGLAPTIVRSKFGLGHLLLCLEGVNNKVIIQLLDRRGLLQLQLGDLGLVVFI